MKHKLYYSKLPFTFLSDEELLSFLEWIFSNSLDKKRLYEAIVDCNTQIIYASCFDESIPEEQQIQVFNALELLEESYGSFYDPEKVLFNSHNKIKYN
jgi:hypothetical protein